MSNQVKGTTTDLTKLVHWDIDHRLVLDDEIEYHVCLTKLDMYDLSQALTQFTWLTRWTSEQDTPKPAQYYLDRRATYLLDKFNTASECGMSDCEDIENCVSTQLGLSGSALNYALDKRLFERYGLPDGGYPDGYPDFVGETVIVSDDFACDLDNLFAFCVQVVEFTDIAIQDFFQLLEFATQALEIIADVVSAIPILGLFPFDEAVELVDEFIETVMEAYQGAQNSSLKIDMACSLFCYLQTLPNCSELTIEQLFQFWLDLLVYEITHLDIGAIANMILTGTFIGDKYVQACYVFYWGIVLLGSKWFGKNLKFIQRVLASYSNDTNNDWTTLCDECPEETFSHEFNFLVENGGFTRITTGASSGTAGNWVLGTGWVATDTFYPSSTRRRILYLTKSFSSRVITKIRVEYSLTKSTWSNPAEFIIADRSPGNPSLANVDITNASAVNGSGQVLELTGSAEISSFTLRHLSSLTNTNFYGGSAIITKVIVEGIGTDPF